MHKPKLGIICVEQDKKTDKKLFNSLQEKFEIILFPIQKDIDFSEMKLKAKDISLVLNNAAYWPITYDSLEIAKTFEGLGKKVIDSTNSLYYHEDKWMFYQTCLKHKLPTPTTYFIPFDILSSPGKLKEIISSGPLVFKSVLSELGKAVKLARNYKSSLKIIENLHKSTEHMPMIAQKYIPHGKVSYRITMMGNKIIQGVIKYGKNWKEGKLFWKNEKYRLFKPDRKLVSLCRKTAKAFGIDWCGIDLMKDSDGKWYLIEINSCPGMDFIVKDIDRMNKELANYLLNVQGKISR